LKIIHFYFPHEANTEKSEIQLYVLTDVGQNWYYLSENFPGKTLLDTDEVVGKWET